MSPALLNQIMKNIFSSGRGIKPVDWADNVLSTLIINELAGNWNRMPDTTKALLLSIAYDLKVPSMNTHLAELKAQCVIEQARQRPS